MLFGNSPYHCSVPLVTVPSAGEDSSAAFERHALGRCYLVATHISTYHEFTDFVASDAVGDVCQHSVEAFQLITARVVLNDASILAQTSEIEMPYHMRMNNKRRSRACWWQLLEV